MLPKFLKPYHTNKSNLVRLGPKTDGGYIIDKRILRLTNTLITCGLNDDWEFERDFWKRKIKCQIAAYDHTINKEFWWNRFKKDFIAFLLFRKLRISKILDIFKYLDYKLFFNDKKHHYQKKIVFKKKNNKEITIPEILSKFDKIILKVDIEGDEYKILNDIKKNTNKIIHIHGNNYGGLDKYKDPKVIELSLINSKMVKVKKILCKNRYPVKGLDYKNFKRREEIKIRFYE